jgi:hypothetical protein
MLKAMPGEIRYSLLIEMIDAHGELDVMHELECWLGTDDLQEFMDPFFDRMHDTEVGTL